MVKDKLRTPYSTGLLRSAGRSLPTATRPRECAQHPRAACIDLQPPRLFCFRPKIASKVRATTSECTNPESGIRQSDRTRSSVRVTHTWLGTGSAQLVALESPPPLSEGFARSGPATADFVCVRAGRWSRTSGGICQAYLLRVALIVKDD
eukprot:8702044-Pyramimonas_sp.AAC.1